MRALFEQFLNDESGATAIEYSLIAAGVMLAIVAVVKSLGSTLNTTFTNVATGLK
jgi:pilus assembly protein Flp/PilA